LAAQMTDVNKEPEADENSALAQAYEYLLARLTWPRSIISRKLRVRPTMK